jgi:large subunit ribosomal protein L15
MNLNNLKPAQGSTHHEKRIGRGQGSGHGGTSTRGHKGAQSRSGYSQKLGFEGGQMPLQRRLPKFGFTNLNRIEYKPINLSVIEELATKHNLTEISIETLIEHGFVSKNDHVKILGNGTLSHKLKVTAHGFSKSAVAAIEAKEGTVVKL